MIFQTFEKNSNDGPYNYCFFHANYWFFEVVEITKIDHSLILVFFKTSKKNGFFHLFSLDHHGHKIRPNNIFPLHYFI
jgi:hypothetical protein